MSERRYNQNYSDPAINAHYSGQAVSGPNDQKLVDSSVNTYAFTRRNNLCFTANTPINALPVSSSQYSQAVEVFSVPLGYRIVDGDIKVLVYYQLGADGSGDNEVTMHVKVGEDSTDIALTSAAAAWASATITVSDASQSAGAAYYGDPKMSVTMSSQGVNTVTIKSLCAYQPAATGAPTWTTVSDAGNKLGTDDWPNSALSYRLMRDAVVAVRENRTKKANVFTHWWGLHEKTGNAYAAAFDDLGRYKLVKREGIGTVRVHLLGHASSGSNNFTMRAQITGTDHSNATSTVTYATTSEPGWESISFVMASTDITSEQEIELRLDAKDDGSGDTLYMPGVCVVEVPISASSITHTVPNVAEVGSGSIIGSEEWSELVPTMDSLWRRGGSSISLADWRFGSAGFTDMMNCDGTSKAKEDFGYDKTSVAARCLVYPSTSSKRLFVRVGFKTATTGKLYKKHIELMISNSLTEATYDSIGPGGSGAFTFSAAYTGTTQYVQGWCDIPSAAWETPSVELGPGDVPYQVWVFCWTENDDEYIKPDYVTIQELPLDYEEFP